MIFAFASLYSRTAMGERAAVVQMLGVRRRICTRMLYIPPASGITILYMHAYTQCCMLDRQLMVLMMRLAYGPGNRLVSFPLSPHSATSSSVMHLDIMVTPCGILIVYRPSSLSLLDHSFLTCMLPVLLNLSSEDEVEDLEWIGGEC
jgi:hypothetical protein